MMDTLKFTLLSIVVLGLFGFLLTWAVTHLQSGTDIATSQKMQQLQQENSDLTKQVANLTSKPSATESKPAVSTPAIQDPTPTPTPAVSASTSVQPTTYKNQDLINAFQQLITDKISMKLKSNGTRVGTVQNFLNIYNNTPNKVDNSYGASTEKEVAVFQKDQGLTADGQASSSTFSKMISWLKKQG